METMGASKSHAACSGCSLCLLVCPMWRQNRDIALTAHGYAKALQHGANANEIAAAVWRCSLCGACDPVCPECIDVTGMILNSRRQLTHFNEQNKCAILINARFFKGSFLGPENNLGEKDQSRALPTQNVLSMLLPDPILQENPDTLARVAALLGKGNELVIAEDEGADIALALEAGVEISPVRLQRFLDSMRQFKKIVVASGLLLKHLRTWLPALKFISLGEALSSMSAVRCSLRTTDLYVIEPRAYHADYQRLVKYYDRLRAESGCAFNLDLQRIAIPATLRSLSQRLGLSALDDDEQARWVLHGRNMMRIVVESLEDKAVFEKVSDVEVVYLADL